MKKKKETKEKKQKGEWNEYDTVSVVGPCVPPRWFGKRITWYGQFQTHSVVDVALLAL